MKRRYFLLTLALAGGAVTYHLAVQRSHEAQLGQVRADVASLSTAMAEAKRSAAEERARPLPARVVISAAPEREPPAPMEQSASSVPLSPSSTGRTALEPAEVRAKVDAVFTGEEIDRAWATQAQATARARIAAVLPETSSLRSVECRSSMCRFETVHEDAEHGHQFVQRAFLDPETQVWNGGLFSSVVPEPGNDKVVVVSYLARDGENLDPTELLR